jgi:diguanylate cyclase (GGDEF)-like protein
MIADTHGSLRRGAPSRWELWRLPGRVQVYILCVHAAAVAALVVAAENTRWNLRDGAVCAALLCCAAVTIEATRRINVAHGAVSHDMQVVWYIAAVAVLPPFYTMLIPLLLVPVRLTRMVPGVTYRRVCGNSICALAYGGVATIFHLLPAAVAGHDPGAGTHAITWLAVLACCSALGLAVNNALIIIAIKLSDPGVLIRTQALDREGAVSDLCQLSLGVLIAFPAAFSPYLLIVALPVVIVLRRFMMHAQLVTASRMDTKTGLLNALTWQREAELEVSRSVRIRSPLAIAVVDVDHFKAINDQHGHLSGDAVLALTAATMAALLRDYDIVGRFGGDEFAICLPHTNAQEARQVTERLRDKISQISTHSPGEAPVQITISIGVASLESSSRSLDELIAAADAALYQAKKSGRNCVRITRDEQTTSR